MERPRRQGYRGRVRTGCLTCRARKVKCDEARPMCSHCNRLMLQCIYKSPISTRQTANKERLQVGQLPDANELTSPSRSESPLQERWRSSPPESPIAQRSMQKSPGQRPKQTPLLYQGSTNIDVTVCLAKVLESRSVGALNNGGPCDTIGSPEDLISRDIELTTTIDILALRTQSPYMSEIFLEAVDCPGITPFDCVNWKLAKHHFVQIGKSCAAVASCVAALSTLYNEQVHGLSCSGSLSHYHAGRNSIEEVLSDTAADFEIVLAASFLTCAFEMVHYGDVIPYLREPGSLFMRRLHVWAQTTSLHTDLAKRIITWLRILHSITCRGGAMGLISDEVVTLFPNYNETLPNIKPPIGLGIDTCGHLYEVLSGPIFNFYLQLQLISGQIARLSLYHRSRTKATDQQEVVEHMDSLKSCLRSLWDNRCSTLRQSPTYLRSELSPRTADKIIDLIGICEAAYYAELVDINRQLGDPVSISDDSREALHKIRAIIEQHGNSSSTSDSGEKEQKLNPGYLRPLFLYAIENTDRDQSTWAVQRIAQIQGPIYRGQFFSRFAEALAEAQVQNDRRVTSRYFCIWYFGTTPPFL
ncbi:hypothetical protein CC79DRAFT_1312399 [Sarocladium strictum]